MRPPTRLMTALYLCALLATPLASGADDAAAADEERRIREALAPRYLPEERGAAPPLVERLHPAPAPLASERESVLTRMFALRLRQLAGPRPADPRRRIQTGDVALRVPLGETFEMRPGVRIEYERHPVDDLWVGDPVPTLTMGVRF